MTYDNKWLYKGEEVLEAPEEALGFVYLLTNNVNNKKYIGKKILKNTKKLKPLKGKKRKRVVVKESNWKSYYGSSAFVKEDVEEFGAENWTREILIFCNNKTEMTYFETKFQFDYDVLYSRLENGEKEYYNGNISGKFYFNESIDEKLNPKSS